MGEWEEREPEMEAGLDFPSLGEYEKMNANSDSGLMAWAKLICDLETHCEHHPFMIQNGFLSRLL